MTNPPKLSIITAVHPNRTHFLPEAAASIAALRNTIDIQWLVAWDGEPSATAHGADVEISGRVGSGISCTRNLTLADIRAPFVTTLDADDEIVSTGALAAHAVLTERAEFGWIAMSRVFATGKPSVHTFNTAHEFEIGELAETWTAPFRFHPNSVVYRSSKLRALGGWPAVVCNEDLGLALMSSEHTRGAMIPATLTKYRVWDQQEVGRPDYTTQKRLAFQFIQSNINAIRQGRGADPIKGPTSPGGALGTREASST